MDDRFADQAMLDALPFPFSVWEAIRVDGEIVDFRCLESNSTADDRIGALLTGRTRLAGLRYNERFAGLADAIPWHEFVEVVEQRNVKTIEAAAPGYPDTWFENVSAPFGDGFVNFVRDISKRRRMMRALASNEELFRSTMDALADAVFLADPVRDERSGIVDLRLRYCNEAAGRMLATTSEELLDRLCSEVFPDEIAGRCLQDVATSGVATRFEIPWIDHPPLRGSFEVDARPVGEGLVIVAHDVTDRVVAEQQARESERLYRLLADHAGDVVIAAKHGLVQWAAPSLERLLGWTFDDVAGRTALDFVHPDEHDIVDNATFSASYTTRSRVRLRQKDGTWRWVDLLARIAGPDDQPEHPLVITIIDAQAEVEARDALQRAELERLHLDERVREAARLESLSQLAGGVAHDFNNLLVGILGNAELALQDLPSSSPLRSRLVSLSAAAQRAAELTRQLLDFTGRQPREHVALDPAPIIADTIDLAHSLMSKEVTIGFSTDQRSRGVFGDRSQLQQVVMNLLMNAGEAVDAHAGHIHVSLALVEITDDPDVRPGEYVSIEVTDDGRGIDGEQLRRIFDPFFTTRSDGRGLGLAVVSGIVRAHQGTVRVRSELGQGTTFTVLLPATDLPDPVPSTSTSFRLHRQPTVMVVDDDDQVRDIVGDVLRRAGFQVIAVARGREAIGLFATRHATIDCVVLDLTMPDLTGDEVMVVLRAVAPNVPIVLISGYLGSDPVREAATMKATDFVQKPFLPDDLVDAVRRSLHQTPFQGPYEVDYGNDGRD
ncbi:MAG: ATP-binding protein [Acidimicrobiales bacterium]